MKTKRAYLIISALVLAGILAVSWIFAPVIAPAFLNAVLMFVLPLSIGALIFSRTKADWSLFGVGALTFIGSQVLHIPFNSYLLEPAISAWGLEMSAGTIDLVLLALLYGLSAGVFEEFARYFVYKKWLKEHKSWRSGIMFGAGHGGVEALILGVLVLFAFFQMLALQGATPETLAGSVPIEQVDLAIMQIDHFWASPWWMHLLGAAERLFAITLHIAMALLVQRSILRKRLVWLGAAVLFHTLFDAAAVYASVTYSPVIAEAVIFVFALFALWIIIKFGKDDQQVHKEMQGESTPPRLKLKPIKKITAEDDLNSKLEESKYD